VLLRIASARGLPESYRVWYTALCFKCAHRLCNFLKWKKCNKGENWQKLRNLEYKSWDLLLQNCRELLQSEQKREFGKCKYWETWSCCLDADLPRPWTPIKASRRADSAEFSATCFVVVCAAIAVHFFVMLLELCWPAWALWANRSTSLHDPLPRSSFPLPSRVLVCAPQARQASPVWHTNAIARHSCSASLSLSDCLTQTYSLLVPEASFASFYTNGIKTSPSLFLYRFLHKRKRWFPTALDSSRTSQTLSQTHLHSSTLLVPAWLLLLLSTQIESEDLHHCFCTNFYSKEIADFHQPQIRERSPLTRHSPWKRGWHTETKKVRSNWETSCFAKRTLFLWRRVITNRDTFVVSSRKEEEPQIRHQIQIRVAFFRFTISELHFIFNSHLFPSYFDLRVRTQQLDW
jgi:hypothetical protein